MQRNLFLSLLLTVAVAGCTGGSTSNSDGDGGNGDPSVVDRGEENGEKNARRNGDGSASEQAPPGGMVTPTEDLSEERQQAAAMDVPELIDALSDPQLADAASDELAGRGSASVEPLVRAIESSDDPLAQQRAAFTLGQLGAAAKPALPKLKEIREGGQSEVLRDTAAFAIDAIEGN